VIDTRWGGTDIGRVSLPDELDQHVRGRPRIAFHSSSYYYQIRETIRTLVVAQIVDLVLVNMFVLVIKTIMFAWWYLLFSAPVPTQTTGKKSRKLLPQL
jgi:hypothetical protein